jgi:NAD(P)-dependent dehydrogenase (short-subunit alcohol dehydrogenase family)
MSERPVAIITAAGSGMGAAIARELARRGYAVAILSSSGKGEALAGELGGMDQGAPLGGRGTGACRERSMGRGPIDGRDRGNSGGTTPSDTSTRSPTTVMLAPRARKEP